MTNQNKIHSTPFFFDGIEYRFFYHPQTETVTIIDEIGNRQVIIDGEIVEGHSVVFDPQVVEEAEEFAIEKDYETVLS